MSLSSPVIVWFRQDLRVADNPALAAASGRPIVAVYILDNGTGQVRTLGGAASWWLHHSLESLSVRLSQLGVNLILRQGAAADVLDDLLKETGAEAVFVAIVPERTALVPEARVAAMPPSEAFAPGSTGKKRPVSRR